METIAEDDEEVSDVELKEILDSMSASELLEISNQLEDAKESGELEESDVRNKRGLFGLLALKKFVKKLPGPAILPIGAAAAAAATIPLKKKAAPLAIGAGALPLKAAGAVGLPLKAAAGLKGAAVVGAGAAGLKGAKVIKGAGIKTGVKVGSVKSNVVSSSGSSSSVIGRSSSVSHSVPATTRQCNVVQKCYNKPVQKCRSDPVESCWDEPVENCWDEPQQRCYSEPRQQCQQVPEQRCWEVRTY